MRYQVIGMRVEQVTVNVQADSAEEAIELANECHRSEIDVWDTDYNWVDALEAL